MIIDHIKNLYAALNGDIAFVKGGVTTYQYDTDRPQPFFEEANFEYLTGCDEANMAALFDSKEQRAILLMPRYGLEHAIWVGYVETPEDKKAKYPYMEIAYIDELDELLAARKGRKCHVYNDIAGIPNQCIENSVNDLPNILVKMRLHKDPEEIAAMRHACYVNSEAVNYVFSHYKPGMKEVEAAAYHDFICQFNKCPIPSFNIITSTGSHGSVLHYMKSDTIAKEGDSFLLDSGCEYKHYCSDHTRVFPVGRRFTQKQAELYQVAVDANLEGIKLCKPGVTYDKVHLAVSKKTIEGLRKYGLVKSEYPIEEEVEAGIGFIFQPHGLGHMVGETCHNVLEHGGAFSDDYPRSKDFRLKYLRTTRKLEPGMMITVEPGLYFADGFLKIAENDPKMAKHLNFDVIREYQKECGGYRMEDDVVITEDGCEVMPGPAKSLKDLYALRDLAFSY